MKLDEIYCGDALDLLRQMEEGSVDAIITDPPYGIDYQSAWRIEKTRKTASFLV